MYAIVQFTGIIAGIERQFAPGDTISAGDAKEMGLADKPELAQTAKPKEAAVAATANP